MYVYIHANVVLFQVSFMLFSPPSTLIMCVTLFVILSQVNAYIYCL